MALFPGIWRPGVEPDSRPFSAEDVDNSCSCTPAAAGACLHFYLSLKISKLTFVCVHLQSFTFTIFYIYSLFPTLVNKPSSHEIRLMSCYTDLSSISLVEMRP